MSIARIKTIQKHPNVFGGGLITLPPEWESDHDIIPIPKPDNLAEGDVCAAQADIIETEMAGEIANTESRDGRNGISSGDWEFPGITSGAWPGAHQPGGGNWNPLGGASGGTPSSVTGTATDCLAFYLPFHYFGPTWWGIYLIKEGVGKLARFIYVHSGGSGFMDALRAVRVARIFLYNHEHFHHRVECFGLRFEMMLRKPCYATVFESLYRKHSPTASWSEEGLANANALEKVWSRTGKNRSIMTALDLFVTMSPPGYNRGVKTWKKMTATMHEFAEVHQKGCVPRSPKLPANLWASTPHFLTGISNVTSRVKYIIPKGAPLGNRTSLRRP